MITRSISKRCLLLKCKGSSRNFCLPVQVEKNEVEYPPILDITPPAEKERKFLRDNVDAVKKCGTVEEKIFKINMPRYYGWKPVLFHENVIEYNSLPMAQYVTRTYVMPEKSLPASYYNEIISPEEVDILVQQLKANFEETLLFEYEDRLRQKEIDPQDSVKPDKLENFVTNALLKQANRFLQTNLSSKYSHLLEAEVDFEPRLEAFWSIGGIPKNKRLKKKYGNSPGKYAKTYAELPDDRWLQYFGHPVVQLRHELPLKEILPYSESENPNFAVPDYKYCPSFLGYHREARHGTIIPGFWPGDPSEFGLLSLHNRGHFVTRSPKLDDNFEALVTQAIFASFGWLYGQACYQGFSTFNDITYPLVHQSVISNGQFWSFFAYQLNTTAFFSYNLPHNKKSNLCWATEPMKLFECIENGKMQGFNDDVLKHLIKLYANVPQKRNIEMKPYLGEARTIAEISDAEEERRTWLEEHYKHLMANVPHTRPMRRILLWQKIYMIDHKTRPLEKKREPWEFNINPWARRLDDHTPMYVPKCLRGNPTGKKKKYGRYRKDYYP